MAPDNTQHSPIATNILASHTGAIVSQHTDLPSSPSPITPAHLAPEPPPPYEEVETKPLPTMPIPATIQELETRIQEHNARAPPLAHETLRSRGLGLDCPKYKEHCKSVGECLVDGCESCFETATCVGKGFGKGCFYGAFCCLATARGFCKCLGGCCALTLYVGRRWKPFG